MSIEILNQYEECNQHLVKAFQAINKINDDEKNTIVKQFEKKLKELWAVSSALMSNAQLRERGYNYDPSKITFKKNAFTIDHSPK
jgi:hypothetical protein